MESTRCANGLTRKLGAVRRASLALAGLVLFAIATPAVAQLPHARLNWIYPAGGKAGASVEVSVGGTDLDNATGLYFSHPGITAQVKTGPATPLPKPPVLPGQFTVTIAADVPPGLYEARAIGLYGASTPRSFAVGDLEEALKVDGNSEFAKAQEIAVGTTVNGRAIADTDDYYKFPAKAGQRLTISIWAYRLDSRLDGSITLFDGSGAELASSRDVKGFEPVIDYTVPADGEYVVAVHDFTYRGGPEYAYRLSVSEKPYLAYVFPPSGLAGTTSKFTLYGHNLPGGAPAADPLAAKQGLQQLEVDIALPATAPDQHPASHGSVAEPQDEHVDGLAYRLPSPAGFSNPVFISFATAPVVREVEPNDAISAPQTITLPCEVVGQFSPIRDSDWFTFEAKKGDVYTVEVFSQRLGLPTDPQVIIKQLVKNENGEPVKNEAGEVTYKDILEGDDYDPKLGNPGFDRASADPVVRFAPAEDGTYLLLVRDLYGGSQATGRLVYRLSIRPETPDFRLLATLRNLTDPDKQKLLTANPVLRKGGSQRLMAQIYPRDGFNGEITISVEGLPPGVTCPAVTATPNDKQVTLVLSAAADAAEWTGPIKIVGRAKVGEQELTRVARPAYVVWDKVAQTDFTYSRIAQQLVLSVTREADPANVETGIASGEVETARAGKVEIPVKVTRAEGFKGGLKLDPVGLPKEITGGSLTLDEKTAEGKIELTIAPNAAPGLYNLFLAGQSKLAYKRNEFAVEEATAVKTEAEARMAEIMETVKTTTEAKTAAEKQAADAAAALKTATDAVAAAQKGAAEAEAAAKAAAEKAAAAKTAATNAAGDQALADAAAQAEKAAADAEAARKTAADALQAAQKTMTDAHSTGKAADAAKTTATEAANAAAETLKQAQAEKAAIDKAVTDLTAAAQPKDIDVFVQSPPIALKVAPAPVNLKLSAPTAGPVKQGETIELPLGIERLYGFADTAEIVLTVPQNFKGLSGKLDLAAGAADGKLAIVAAKDAPVGKHALQITAKVKFNGQPVELSVPVEVTVEAAPAEEKK